MEQAKQYVIMMGAEIMYGPDTDYAKVKAFMDSLAPAMKMKCVTKVIKPKGETAATPAPAASEQAAPAEEPVKQTPPPAAAKPAATVAKTAKPAPVQNSSDANQAFGAFLEGGGQSNFWKPKDGRNIVRFLPIGGVLPTDWVTPYPFLLAGVHPNVGLSLKETVYCARLTHNKACPICQFVWKLYNTKDENDIAIAKRIKGYNRVIANIIDLADVDKGVQKFAFGKTLGRKLMSYMEDPEFVPLLDEEKGHNFIVIKKTVDGYPNYDDSRPEVKMTSLATIYPEWKKEASDLRKEIVEKTYDELLAILKETQKAILSTDMNDMESGPTSRGTGAADTTAGIEEMSAEDIKQRLENV